MRIGREKELLFGEKKQFFFVYILTTRNLLCRAMNALIHFVGMLCNCTSAKTAHCAHMPHEKELAATTMRKEIDAKIGGGERGRR